MNETLETMIQNGSSLEVLSTVDYEWLLDLASKGGRIND